MHEPVLYSNLGAAGQWYKEWMVQEMQTTAEQNVARGSARGPRQSNVVVSAAASLIQVAYCTTKKAFSLFQAFTALWVGQVAALLQGPTQEPNEACTAGSAFEARPFSFMRGDRADPRRGCVVGFDDRSSARLGCELCWR